ncbi:hypothetical protein ACQQ2N_08755 [Dokdonella sp. MW10]|uniref:hypothetical protein n=1 Tax=Dokdonella sp. MW10 TaxID=2992926 RepID=UPI003F7F6886
MRIRPDTSFPYPVLSDSTGDYGEKKFDLTLEIVETPSTARVILEGSMHLDDEALRRTIDTGKAKSGLMITCVGTYFDRFQECDLNDVRIDLAGGKVRGTVYVRGVLLATQNNVTLESESINAEFPAASRTVQKGDFLALTEEFRFEAGLEKLARLESIFRLKKVTDLPEGRFVSDFESEAIHILAPPSLYDTLYNLRANAMKNLLLPALYLPVVMSALDAMRSGNFDDRRWHVVMKARCDAAGIDVNGDLAEAAQKLLDGPLGLLKPVVELGS